MTIHRVITKFIIHFVVFFFTCFLTFTIMKYPFCFSDFFYLIKKLFLFLFSFFNDSSDVSEDLPKNIQNILSGFKQNLTDLRKILCFWEGDFSMTNKNEMNSPILQEPTGKSKEYLDFLDNQILQRKSEIEKAIIHKQKLDSLNDSMDLFQENLKSMKEFFIHKLRSK